MPGGGSGSTQTSVNLNEPPAFQLPFLKEGMGRAESLYQQGAPEFYPGSTVVPFAPQSELALDLTEDRALSGSPLLGQAQGEMSKTLSGDYLTQGNPYMAALTERIRNLTQPAVDSRFAASRRTGSGAHQETYARALTDAVAPHLFQSYESERGRMGQAAQLAPGLAQADYLDIDRLAGVGREREAQAGAELQGDIERFNFNQLRPEQNLKRYMDMIRGSYGGTQTTSQPIYRNQVAGGAGGLLAGLGAAQQLGFNPWLGAGAGALLGIL